MQHFTRSQLDALPTHELIKLYNTIAGKSITRFASRETGVKQLLKALAERAKLLPKGAVRTIRDGKPDDGKSSKAGRPSKVFTVKLAAEGKSEVRSTSLRGQIIAHMKTTDGVATVTDLEKKFGEREARGAIQKLMQVEWLTRVDQ